MIKDETASIANRAGLLYGTLAYTLWGFLPLYWKLLEAFPAVEILAHRIFWSFFFMALVVICTGGRRCLALVFADRKKLLLIFLCGFVVSANWLTYIYTVNSGRVLEASMGYYINPLVVVLLGVFVLGEKLGRWQLVALLLATAGVLIITLQYGRVPWLALILAGTFALYGLIKKIIGIDPIAGLVLETAIVAPLALVYIVFLQVVGRGAPGSASFLTLLVLAGTGLVTVVPLFLYAQGISLTTFSMMGFLQYIAPTINFFLGIFVFREYFSQYHLISFGLIWAALLIFTLANTGLLPAAKQDRPEPADEVSPRG